MRARGEGLGARDPRILWTVALAALLLSCGPPRREPVTVHWTVGQMAPTFDPQGPPDPVRWAIERLLSRGLVEEDSSGNVVLAAAESVRVSADGLLHSFRLRPGLTFADGTPCGSGAFRAAIENGVNRLDHGTYAWLLSGLEGMSRVRPGRPLPPLGIETPDARTLILKLAWPDSLLLRKLAFPGTTSPWRPSSSAGPAMGIGDYKVEEATSERLTLVRRLEAATSADTIRIRFAPGTSRLRALMRTGAPDLLWPPAPDLLDRPLPEGYEAESRPARPPRHLVLVMRADLPPTSRSAARHALAHGLNREELMAALGPSGTRSPDILAGSAAFRFPANDPAEIQAWLERGKLGRSLHVVLAFSSDGAAARIAPAMQGEWARGGLDVELRPLRQPRMAQEAIRRGGAQLLLVESQSWLDRPEGELIGMVQSPRGPAVGPFRTGWVTGETEAWSRDPGAPSAAMVAQRLADERVVLPLARLPWLWVQRAGSGGSFHPRFGPDPRRFQGRASAARR